MRNLYFLLILIVISPVELLSQELKLGLWKDGRTTKKAYYHSEEPVTWMVDGNKLITVAGGRTSYFSVETNGLIKFGTSQKTYGRYKKISLTASAESYILKRLDPKSKEERYDQGLVISNRKGGLHLVNQISDIDAYVAGVVEGEAGKGRELEYYKAQAVICRTYALSNIRKHEHEGYNMCDQVHCQVYHGIARHDTLIPQAARASEGQVLVDSNLELITAAFHSNCGGHTVNSEDVWSKAVPYLRARPDTFCLAGAHAIWEATVLKSAWNNYLQEKAPAIDLKQHAALYSFSPEERSLHYPNELQGMKLKDLRYKWQLRSTYFSIEDAGDAITLRGKGFGHGVGLCQEGAMGMVSHGYNYPEVLQFYYKDVHLVHLSVLDFFKEN